MRGSGRPIGTVTFLFTDIEGSTRLWEDSPELMRAALARHDAILRDSIQQSNGYVFKTMGDAFCAAFATAAEALQAASMAQLALTAEQWATGVPIRVRMAVHTGGAESRDDDYFGPSVNRVARLLSSGHGGQVLLSQAAYELVRDFLPEPFGFQDLGGHKLKDLARPEQVFQLVHPALPRDLPPLRTLSSQPNNLPQQLTSFVGREREMQLLEGMLDKHRLVTMTGSGGTGKTRLSLQVAANTLENYPDGAWLIELAPLTDPGLVARTVADVLMVKDQPDKPLIKQISDALGGKRLLLILDNCEHLLDACADLVDQVLRNCPQVTVLATSREALGLLGESTYRLPSLSVPNPKEAQSAATLSHFESVRLFIDRAEQALSTFSVTNQNAPALASLCFRLDGIPLAIELAAARTRSLSVEEIESRLDHRFRLLTGGSRTALPRQQTLRSLIDWSYDLLSESEKLLLSRLSVFSGGWTLEAAEEVCSDDVLHRFDVFDLMNSLCDKNLVVAEERSGQTRYGLLETIRQYALDRLSEAGEDASCHDRHLHHFLSLAEAASPHLGGSLQRDWFRRLETEHDNIRVALERSRRTARHRAAGLRMAGVLWRFWFGRGHLSEGRQRLLQALDDYPDADQDAKATALYAEGNLACIQGDFAAGQECLSQSLAIWQGLGKRWDAAAALNALGNVEGYRNDVPAAAVYWEKSLAIWRELEADGQLGDPAGIAATLDNLGNVARFHGEHEAARNFYLECLELRRQLGNVTGVAYSSINLGACSLTEGHIDQSRERYSQALIAFSDLGDPIGMAASFEGLAWLSPPLTAAHLLGAAEKLRKGVGAPLLDYDLADYDRLLAKTRASAATEAEFQEAWREGASMSRDALVALALGEKSLRR